MTTIEMQLTEVECKRPYPLDPDEAPAFRDLVTYPIDRWWEEIGQHSSRFRLRMIDLAEPKQHMAVESPTFFRDGRKPGEKEAALLQMMDHAAKALAKRIV